MLQVLSLLPILVGATMGVFCQAENSPDNYEVTSYSSKCINYVIFPVPIAVFHILGISMQSIEEFVAP